MMLRIGKAKINKAFTLIEIILVVLITSILLVMALPNFAQGYGKIHLRQVSEDLLNVARWSQGMAMAQQRIYRLSFSDDHHGYEMTRSSDEDNQSGIFEKVKGTLGRKHRLPADVSVNIPESSINFYPDGTIDPVTIELISPTKKTVLSSAVMRGVLMVVDNE